MGDGVSACLRCSEMPGPACAVAQVADCVLVYAPAPPALRKVRLAATRAGYCVQEFEDAVLILRRAPGDWSGLLTAIEADLSSLEALETRLAPIGGLPGNGQEITLAALKARTLPALLSELRDSWLSRALDTNAVTS